VEHDIPRSIHQYTSQGLGFGQKSKDAVAYQSDENHSESGGLSWQARGRMGIRATEALPAFHMSAAPKARHLDQSITFFACKGVWTHRQLCIVLIEADVLWSRIS
jgi:hypothetical protein